MSALVFDHPWMQGMFRGQDLREQFSADADIAAMLRFEKALAAASADCGLITHAASKAISEACDGYAPQLSELQQGFSRDGVVVPELIRQLRELLIPEYAECLHLGATSQDVVDTSLVIRIKNCLAVLQERLTSVERGLENLAMSDGNKVVMGHTRMQAARIVKVSHILDPWQRPLDRHQVRLDQLISRLLQVQLGGGTGDMSLFGANGDRIRQFVAIELDLSADAGCWHTARDGLAELASWCSLVTGTIGKLGQDVALLAQSEIGSIKVENSGGSSAMEGKQNPVAAELLVAVARFNATQVSSIHHAMVHENQRSGAAWTLEWMGLPQMILATNAGLAIAHELIANITFVEKS